MTRAPRWTANAGYPADEAVALAREASACFPKAAMFDLRDRGFASVFQQLVACIVSIRTRDEDSLPASIRLFEAAPSAADVAALDAATIERLISPATFRERKSAQIRAIARRTVEDFGGELPCDGEVLRGFDGVGPKCANLALGVACGRPVVSVDVHVHRVTNRWGLVRAATPERTGEALESVLPVDLKVEINRVLVPFGKHVCTGTRPRCSVCPVLPICAQIGVWEHR
jgi:endonuclease III